MSAYITAGVHALRAAMGELASGLGLETPTPDCGVLQAIDARIMTARIALREIAPKALGGYGTLSASDEQGVAAMVSRLDGALARLQRGLGRNRGVA
jgi:hypothetical protein